MWDLQRIIRILWLEIDYQKVCLWDTTFECDSTWSHENEKYYIWFDIAIDVGDTKLDCLLFTWILIWIFSKVFKSSLHHLMQCAWICVHLSPWFNPYDNKITFFFPRQKKKRFKYNRYVILATCGWFFFFIGKFSLK